MLSKEQLEEYERKYPGVVRLVPEADASGKIAFEILVRPPTRAEYRALKEEVRNPRTASEAQENLILGCVVHPEREALNALLERYAALCDGICNDPGVQRNMGLTIVASSKR